MKRLTQTIEPIAQLVEAVTDLSTELDHERAARQGAERDCRRMEAAYLDVLVRYRALLSGSLPAHEWAVIDKAAALSLARGLGARRAADAMSIGKAA